MTAPVPSGVSLLTRLRMQVRRYRARAQGQLDTIRFLLQAARGRVAEVWIGDSHAVHMHSASMITAARQVAPGLWVIHLGPRLMYSIAREGFPTAVDRLLRLTRRTRRARDIVWGFSFGEIDVRCHLVPRMSDPAPLAFVPTYVDVVQRAVASAGARRGLILVPPPQSDTYPEQEILPVVGTIVERTDVNRALRTALVEAVSALPDHDASIHLVDVTDEFSDARGWLREELTFDGLHANDAGRAILRRATDAVLR